MRLASFIRWSTRSAFCAALAILVLASPSSAGPNKPGGKTLKEWLGLYMTWALGGDQEDHVGKVRFMPLPSGELVDDGATGTADDPVTYVGEMDVVLRKGESFVLPVAVWYGEAYADGALDPDLDKRVFTHSDVLVVIDEKVILDSCNDDLGDNYVKTTSFDPFIAYDEPTPYGAVGAAFYQGLVIFQKPLSKGVHTMTLRSELIVNDPESGLNFGVKFRNTWNITVE